MLHVRATDGNKGGRLYRIICRECAKQHDFKPNTLSDEKLRRNIIRDGWELGRYRTLHLCPKCADKKAAEPGVKDIAERWTENFLIEIWNTESFQKDRQGLLDYLEWQKIVIADSVQTHPMTLLEIYRVSTNTEQQKVAEHIAQQVRDWLYMSDGQLAEHWQKTSQAERERLLDYLEVANFASRHSSLIAHWKKASGAEREAILASYRHQPKPPPEPNYDDKEPSLGERLVRANKILRKPPGTISKSDFAKKVGVIPGTVSHWLKFEGLPERSDGLLDEAEATQWVEDRRAIRANGDRIAALPSGGPEISNVNDDAELEAMLKRMGLERN